MLRRFFLALVLLAVLSAGALWYAVNRPSKGFATEAFVDIPPGTATGGIATLLKNAGVVESEWQFLLARALRPRIKLQAGEYRFDKPSTPAEVLLRIARGDVFYYEVRVPEGSNMFDVAAAAGKLGFVKEADFLEAVRDPALVRDLAPGATSLEGYLFPSTYHVTRRTSAARICRQMVDQFRKAWKQAGGGKVRVHQIVTLASLVEKETAVPEERSRVASVYANRLQVGMKMDCDPTVIYAAMLEGRYRGTIYRSDLNNPHPYNTYQNPGLPPGPIANPGAASLKAALNPADTKYLFFVAKPDGSGGHVFSESIGAHNAAVQAYRHGQQTR